MFRKFLNKKVKQATSDDVYEILKLSTFGTALSFSTGFSASRYSVSSSLSFEFTFSLFLARELLISENSFLVAFVEQQLKVDSLELTQDAFIEGYRMAISGTGFVSYTRDINAGRAGFTPEMVEPAVTHFVEAAQQAFNEEHETFRLHQSILKDVPLNRKEDIPARLGPFDANGMPFIPLYVQVVQDLAKMQNRNDWGNAEMIYPLAKATVLEGMLMI